MEPHIRLATIEDKENILSLLNKVYVNQQRSNKLRGEEYFNWKFLLSPFGESVLTVAFDNDKMVGVANLWPWEFNVRGRVYKAMQPCDSVVDPSARGKGLFKKMRLYSIGLMQDTDVSFFFNFPNKQSIYANQSLGWNYLGKINWWVKILGPINLAKSHFQKEKSQSFRLPDRFNVNVGLLDKLALEYVVFDPLVKIHRVDGFHNYRYISHPSRDYGMVSYENGSKSSAAVFTINQKGPSREMVIVDLLGSNKTVHSLINLIIKEAKILNIDLIAVMANTPFFQNSLWKKGFVKIKQKNMVVLPLNIRMEHVAKGFAAWDMLACLHDSI